MIILDTHIWYWWAGQSDRWKPKYQDLIEEHTEGGLGVSVISCWEVAKKHRIGKLELDRPVEEWLGTALSYPGVHLIPLTAEIALESTRLPDDFRSDPADEIIVSTARVHRCPLMTVDDKLVNYAHVPTLP